MRSARSWVALGSAGLVVSAATVAMGVPAATAAGGSHHAPAHQRISPALERSHPAGKVAAHSRVSFDLTLSLRHARQARSLVHQVSSRNSAKYHHFLTDAQWERRFSPSHAQVVHAKKWLRSRGFHVGSVPSTRLWVSARGSARKVERAFSTHLGYYTVDGARVRLANSKLRVPRRISGAVAGVVGVNQYVMRPSLALKGATPSTATARPTDAEPVPPAGFRNPEPCSSYWGQKVDKVDSPALYAPYSPKRPYDICGYKPGQLRSAYQTQHAVSNGSDGSGVAVAIVDAYDSPTLLADGQKYASLNDPSNPLAASQFFNADPGPVANEAECGASGWFDEQSLDVEASHAMAPGADILYVGATDCFDSSLLAAEQTAITSGASVVSNSWGSALGDLFDDTATKDAYDTLFMLADSTGVSVLYSSGDDGDNFADFGLNIPDFPTTSPFITAVGGTSLKVGASGARTGEFGWSTAKQVMCAGVPAKNCGSSTTPAGPLLWNSGGGGGTSYNYLQPSYQAGVVPDAIATRNSALFGPTPTRVVPDISMDADAQSGMLIGLTQTFPDGVYYDQFKEGGTSLASPLLAGVVADADSAAGQPVGFLNPDLYQMYRSKVAGALHDVVPVANPNGAATIRVDYTDAVDAAAGYNMSLRALDYEGPETNCDGTGNCATRNVTLNAANGFDSLTGLGVIGASFIPDLAKF